MSSRLPPLNQWPPPFYSTGCQLAAEDLAAVAPTLRKSQLATLVQAASTLQAGGGGVGLGEVLRTLRPSALPAALRLVAALIEEAERLGDPTRRITYADWLLSIGMENRGMGDDAEVLEWDELGLMMEQAGFRWNVESGKALSGRRRLAQLQRARDLPGLRAEWARLRRRIQKVDTRWALLPGD